MKNIVFWNITFPFVPQGKHITFPLQRPAGYCYAKFEVLTAVTMKNGVSWNLTMCGTCKD
jgi:hypothetical protein